MTIPDKSIGPDLACTAVSFKMEDVARVQRWLDHHGASALDLQTCTIRPLGGKDGLDWVLVVHKVGPLPITFYSSWDALAFAKHLFTESVIKNSKHEKDDQLDEDGDYERAEAWKQVTDKRPVWQGPGWRPIDDTPCADDEENELDAA